MPPFLFFYFLPLFVLAFSYLHDLVLKKNIARITKKSTHDHISLTFAISDGQIMKCVCLAYEFAQTDIFTW